MRQQQLVDPPLKGSIELKRSANKRPECAEVSEKSPASKSLWSQWDQFSFRNDVLYRKWESQRGDRVTYHVVLPESLQETALRAHHNHTTASHRVVHETLSALRLFIIGLD